MRFCAGSSWSGLISYAYDLSCTVSPRAEHAVSKDGYLLLSTDIWVGALIRRVELAGSFAYLARKGDLRAGSVILKVLNLRTYETRVYRPESDDVWRRIATADDDYITRQVRYDPDLWVVEIEDVDGRTFLTEKVEGD